MSFLAGIPEQFHDSLRTSIDAVNETNELIRQVKQRFEVEELADLEQKKGDSFDGYQIDDVAIKEFKDLLNEHEARRQTCQQILDQAANG
jgi:hypothetical protein